MITNQIDEEELLDMFCERVNFWTDDAKIANLYYNMYENYINGGYFENCEINIKKIVDNDFINFCDIINNGDGNFIDILAVYQKQGLGDCSCESDFYSYIEAVDDSENPSAFLVRF